MGNIVYNPYNIGTVNSLCIERRGHHDGQIAGDFADQRLRHIDIALHGLLYILAVRIVFAVKDTDAVCTDDISPLEIMHGGALVNDGFLNIDGYIGIRKLWNTACIRCDIFVSHQFLFHAFRSQNGGFAHHVVHGSYGTFVIWNNTGETHGNQRRQNGQNETYSYFCTNAFHLILPPDS